MATLTNTKIKDTYDGLLKTTDNDVIGASEKVITDGLGNASVLSIGTGSASFSGDVDVNSNSLQLTGDTNPTILVTDTTNSVSVGLRALDASTKIDSTHRFNIEIGNDIIHSVTSSGVEITGTLSSTEDATINGLTIGLGSGDITTNTALGLDALLTNTSGSGNVSVGQGSLRTNTTGSGNVAVGKDALRSNTTGGSNIAIGYYSLHSNTTGQNNTAVGSSSLYANTGSYNTALGALALIDNTTGSNNVAIGYASLGNNIDGNESVAVGNLSLNANTTGAYNTAIGNAALYDNTEGQNNTAVGHSSANSNTTGLYNTALGSSALYANETSGSNTALGYNALRDTTGASNTAIGSGAGDTNTTGSNNIYIGYDAVGSAATNDNEIVIGTSATGNGSNTATYGNGSITDHYFNGNITLSDTGNPSLIVQDTAGGSSFLELLAGNTGTSNIYLGDTDDNNAGAIVYDHSDNSMSFRVNGFLEKMRIDSDGNVGIGEQNPTDKLHITDTDTNSTQLVISNANTSDAGTETSEIQFLHWRSYASSQNYAGGIVMGKEQAWSSSGGRQSYMSFKTRGGTSEPAEAMRITSAGDVQLVGNKYLYANPSAGSTTIGSGFNLDGSNNLMTLWTNDTERMRIDSSGNVGINCTPSHTLDVNRGSSGVVANFNGTNAYGAETGISLSQGRAKISGFLNTGGGTPGSNLRFYTMPNSGSVTERMRIDSSGNVGIGTAASTNSRLNVTSSSAIDDVIRWTDATSDTGYLGIDGSGGVKVWAGGFLSFGAGGAGSFSERMRIDSSGRILINGSATPTLTNAKLFISRGDQYGLGMWVASGVSNIISSEDNLALGTAGSERMRIDSSGRVGIGTTPNASYGNLQIKATDGVYALDIIGRSAGTEGEAEITFWNSAQTTIQGYITQDNGNMVFGSGLGASERMRITSGGNVQIGASAGAKLVMYPSSDGFAPPLIRWNKTDTASQTAVQFLVSGAVSGSITYSSTATAYNTSSDYRLKENVVPIEGALDRVDALKPSRFNFITDPEKTVDGFLAHEVAEVIPEAITGEKDAVDEEGNPIYQGIDQSKIVPLLVGAIKELSAKVAALESQLNA